MSGTLSRRRLRPLRNDPALLRESSKPEIKRFSKRVSYGLVRVPMRSFQVVKLIKFFQVGLLLGTDILSFPANTRARVSSGYRKQGLARA
jgi:hypothetical protein